jgi:hypothetical protein
MATFEITAPDGRLFQVTAPEGASQAEVLTYAQQNFGQPSTTLGQKALGVGEAALSAGTGIIGQLLGNVAGVGKEFVTGDFGKGTAEKTAADVQQALTYQPRGQVAPEYLQNVQNVVEAFLRLKTGNGFWAGSQLYKVEKVNQVMEQLCNRLSAFG